MKTFEATEYLDLRRCKINYNSEEIINKQLDIYIGVCNVIFAWKYHDNVVIVSYKRSRFQRKDEAEFWEEMTHFWNFALKYVHFDAFWPAICAIY